MLQERQRTTTVDAFAQTDAFTYNVNYTLNGSVINSVNCSIEKKVVESVPVPGGGTQNAERLVNIGSIYYGGGRRQINVVSDEVLTPHLEAFDQILAEIKAGISPAVEKKAIK